MPKNRKDEDRDSKHKDEHGQKDVSGLLEEGESDWGDAPDSMDISDGKYQVKINTKGEKLGIGQSGSGRRQVVFMLSIAAGEYANRKVFKRDGIDNSESMGWFKSGLKRLGIDPPKSIKDLPDILDELDNTYAEVSIKTNGDFLNAYFNKALDSGDVDTSALEIEGNDDKKSDKKSKWEKGDKVQVKFDGDWYTGEIKKVLDDDKVRILFEDGDIRDIDADDVEEFKPDDDKKDSKSKGDKKKDNDDKVELKFEDSDLEKPQRKTIKEVAGANKFDPDDYKTLTDLAADVAEYLEVEGKFDDDEIDDFIEKLEKASKKKNK